MSNRIAVLMTCHNRRENTLESLRALIKASSRISDIEIHIYIVDDGSTDGTGVSVKQEFPFVNLIYGNGNLFWNRGMLTAWTEASKSKYDFYLWLNDDTVLYEDGLSAMWNDSSINDHKSVTIGVCESKDQTSITYSGMNLVDKKRISPIGRPVICDYFNGNLVLIPNSVFEKVGLLDSTFHHGLGDFDYGLRVRRNGLAAYITSKVVASCDRHDSLPKWCNPDIAFKERYKHFNSPLGGVPSQVFALEKKHFGLVTSLFHYYTIHLRLLFPSIWIKLGKAHI